MRNLGRIQTLSHRARNRQAHSSRAGRRARASQLCCTCWLTASNHNVKASYATHDCQGCCFSCNHSSIPCGTLCKHSPLHATLLNLRHKSSNLPQYYCWILGPQSPLSTLAELCAQRPQFQPVRDTARWEQLCGMFCIHIERFSVRCNNSKQRCAGASIYDKGTRLCALLLAIQRP